MIKCPFVLRYTRDIKYEAYERAREADYRQIKKMNARIIALVDANRELGRENERLHQHRGRLLALHDCYSAESNWMSVATELAEALKAFTGQIERTTETITLTKPSVEINAKQALEHYRQALKE